MARKKVKLAWITNDATRRATFKKRKQGLMKKVSELATLCGVEVCLVVYGPQDSAEAEPELWPSPVEAARLATRFRSMPEMHQLWRKMTNQEGFGDAGFEDAVGLAQMMNMKLKLVQNRLGKETARKGEDDVIQESHSV